MVSKDISRFLKKKFGLTKLGHVGTLDPIASGVLPILVGKATKLQDYLVDINKEYEFDVTFGIGTDTGDSDGAVISKGEIGHLTAERLRTLCAQIHGEVWQIPPVYSAVKYKGQALYKYARSGRSAEVPLDQLGRMVRVERLDLLSFESPIATFRMSCSKGTYVRTIASQIAASAETCGMVSRLVRTRSAGLRVEDTMSQDRLEKLEGPIAQLIVPIEKIALPMPQWRANSYQAKQLNNGRVLQLSPPAFAENFVDNAGKEIANASTFLMLDERGTAIGIGESRSNQGNVSVILKRGFL
jgi:tRNA pseudouridine55 synthase